MNAMRRDWLVTSCRFVVLVLLIVGTVGCATQRVVDDQGQKYQVPLAQLHERLTVSPSALPSEGKQVLVLSGGGSNGAWGAGVLCGWSKRTEEPPRPTFDVVTGISTGALQCSLAFIGDDKGLRDAYLNTGDADVQQSRFLLFALTSNSLRDTRPLRKTIEKYLTEQVIDRVAEAASSDRRVYVASVELNRGELVVWDLVKIAADKSNPQRYDLYRDVVLSSASAPVLYPPVRIGEGLYVDGGVRAQLFLQQELLEDRSHELGVNALRPTVWVIVNGQIGLEPKHVDDRLVPIALRSLECLLDANAIGNLAQVRQAAPAFDVRLSWIPDGKGMPAFEFDKEKMRRLFDAGETFGLTGKWAERVSEEVLMTP